MERLARTIVNHYKIVLLVSLVLALLCGFLTLFVETNYQLADYLPPDAPSTQAIKVLEKEFGSGIPNADIYVPDVSLPEALKIKDEISRSPGVQAVYWLDDNWDIHKPLSLAPEVVRDTFYKDGGARYMVTASTADSVKVYKDLRKLLPKDTAIAGQLVILASTQESSMSEMVMIFLFIFPITLFLLTLATHSYLEPLPLVGCILFGVLLNMGTNVVFKDISFLTAAVGPVLQMAVSMDYAIFLLHRCASYQAEGMSRKEALIKAIPKASVAIMSSSLTTLFGFLALLFMRFRIGSDLGIVLSKGIIFSLLSVTIFLPALLMLMGKSIEKTQHKPLMPPFGGMSRLLVRLRVPIFIFVLILIVPAYMASSHNEFRYSMDSHKNGSIEQKDARKIKEMFGITQQCALLLPRGNWAHEVALQEDLEKIPEITAVVSYNNQVGKEIPIDFVPQGQVKQLISPHYSRMILTVNIPTEGPETFNTMKEIRDTAAKYYGNTYYLAAEAASLLDMKNTVERDTLVVNGLAILAIGLVLLFAFQSFSLPLLLLLTIETSIWLNLSVPYLTDTKLSFIGYLVISTVQLGATVDYGILFSQHYIDARKILGKKEAAIKCITDTAPTLLPPALVLTSAGVLLSKISSIDVVRELGTVLARGASLSLIMVLAFLPALLFYTDKAALGFSFRGRWSEYARKFKKHTSK